MASATSTKATCATCGGKSVGIFKCEGCSQIFCRKHSNEHRDSLSHQLDEIVLEHDILQQTILEENDQKKFRDLLLTQVDQWEKESIEKVHQAAEEVRTQIENLNIARSDDSSRKLCDLAERLRKARMDDDYVETDLRSWSATLQELKHGMNTALSSITVREDSTKLIGNINVINKLQDVEFKERFGEYFGTIDIRSNGSVAVHIGSESEYSDAFVRGTYEYLSGKYKIQFVARKDSVEYCTFFGIIPKSKQIPHDEDDMETSCYGWYSDDDTLTPDEELSDVDSDEIQDLQDETLFEIELLLDCDNQKISYVNQKTKTTRELNIDTTLCPFPWQILFYEYNAGDSVELISSIKLK